LSGSSPAARAGREVSVRRAAVVRAGRARKRRRVLKYGIENSGWGYRGKG
jgi:hypothetical protein